MARIYSALLASGTLTGASNALVYTAPSGKLVVVRDVVLLHDDSLVRRVALYGLSGGVASYIASSRVTDPSSVYHWDGRQVLVPGEGLYVLTDSTLHCFYRVTGYVFDS